MVQRFFNEAQAATAIRNPGIVQVFDFGMIPDGRAYLVMELLEGETLTARLKRQQLDYVECCRIGRQIAKVLQAVHTCGITHRDLKPDNLFLVPDDEVVGGQRIKVLDFGIAKLAGESQGSSLKTRTGAVMGTPTYMSPEQCRGAGAVDARADIYSLGCILFEMTCGHPPFVGEGTGEIVGAHLHVAPPHPLELAPGMPPKLAALIAQMLEKHPGARPQTMTAVGQALDEILEALEGAPRRAPTAWPAPPVAPVSTTLSDSTGVTSPAITVAASRRRFVLAGSIAAGALAGIAVAIALSGPSSPEQPAAPQASGAQPSPEPEAAAMPTESPANAPEPSGSAPKSPGPVPEPVGSTPEPPEPAPERSPEPPRTVEVTIESVPPGATVLQAGTVLGKTPFRGTLASSERDTTLVVRLRGYLDKTIVVRPDKTISKRVNLIVIPQVHRPVPRDRDYGVNPFGK
jgi:serine/threonine-protein kinase